MSFEGLWIDLTINGILIPEKILCEHCRKFEIIYFCLDNFCDSCFIDNHKSLKKNMHEKRPLKDQETLCGEHLEKKSLFCSTCTLEICPSCLKKFHKDHKTYSFEEKIKEMKENYQKGNYTLKMNEIQKNISHVEQKMVKLEKEMINLKEKYQDFSKFENILKGETSMTDLVKLENFFKSNIDNQISSFLGESCLEIIEEDDIRVLIQLKSGKIAGAVNDNTIKIYDSKSLKCEKEFKGHTSMIASLIQLKDESLVSGSYDYTIRIWKIDGKCDKLLKGHKDCVLSLGETLNGKILSGGMDNSIKIWNRSGICETNITLDHFQYSMTLLNNGKFAFGSSDNKIRIWNPEKYDFEKELSGHEQSVIFVIQLKDGRLASSSYEENIRIWNLNNGKCEKVLEGHTGYVYSLIEYSDGNIISISEDQTIRVWDSDGKCENIIDTETQGYCMCSLKDGGIVTGHDDNRIIIWK